MYTINPKINNQISFWLISMFWIISVMIVVGGLTRLTDSGLSITKWELFSGILPPLNQNDWIIYFNLYKEIPEFKLQNFNMTIQEFKVIFWWEWFHRFLGRLIGLAYLIPLLYFSFRLQFKKVLNLYIIFILICLQGFVGWYMVSSGLVDRIDVSHFRLSIHLLLAFFILSLLFWNYLKIKKINILSKKIGPTIPFVFLILIYVQIVIGAFVSGMDAGKIYNSWPLMGNTYFPNDNNYINLLKLSAFNDPSLVQFMHRNIAYIIGVFYVFILYRVYSNKMYELYRSINILGLIISIQIILGIFTIIYGAQIYIAAAHQTSSILLVSCSIYFYYLNTNPN